MVSSISMLPPHLINQIAAGEVVERPVSIVKELVENALDAKATHITLTFRHGGHSYISVEDNGVGMNRDDLLMCLQRHATSKMTEGDLFHIHTYGFRGEALAAMGAVARVVITSRSPEEPHGWRLKNCDYVPGEAIKVELEPCPRQRGTCVEVKDLFFSTPARLHFLKSKEVESSHIYDYIYKMSLVFPQVSFTIQEEKKVHHLPVKDSDQRVFQVFGEKFRKHCLPIDLKGPGEYRLEGSLGDLGFHKSNRNYQYFFVNQRPIRDRTLSAYLRQAYGDILPPSRFPGGVLFLRVPQDDLDVNVHPAKTEVRFRDPKPLKKLFLFSLRDHIRGRLQDQWEGIEATTIEPCGSVSYEEPPFYDPRTGEVKMLPKTAKLGKLWGPEKGSKSPPEEEPEPPPQEAPETSPQEVPGDPAPEVPASPPQEVPSPPGELHKEPLGGSSGTSWGFTLGGQRAQVKALQASLPGKSSQSSPKKEGDPPCQVRSSQEARGLLEPYEDRTLFQSHVLESGLPPMFLGKPLGQVYGTYIVAQGKKGLVLVDPHAAHERILYEKIKRAFRSQEQIATQGLLVPFTYSLSPGQESLLDGVRSLGWLGLEFTVKDGVLSLISVPEYFYSPKGFDPSLLLEILWDGLKDGGDITRSLLESLEKHFGNIGCRRSLKLTQKMTLEEMEDLLRQMENTPHGYVCNHGRPTFRLVTFGDLEKMFHRS